MHAILTTGVGRTEKENVPEKLAKRLGITYNVFKWQSIVERPADKLIQKHTQYGSKLAKMLRKKAYEYGYDAVGYPEYSGEIRHQLNQLIGNVDSDEIVLIGHSWGCVIFYEYLKYLKNDPHNRVKKFITFGNPIPFVFGEDYKSIVDVEWINYYENSDVIAHKMLRRGIEDKKISIGWGPLVHTKYFKSKKLAKKIIKDLEY